MGVKRKHETPPLPKIFVDTKNKSLSSVDNVLVVRVHSTVGPTRLATSVLTLVRSCGLVAATSFGLLSRDQEIAGVSRRRPPKEDLDTSPLVASIPRTWQI